MLCHKQYSIFDILCLKWYINGCRYSVLIAFNKGNQCFNGIFYSHFCYGRLKVEPASQPIICGPVKPAKRPW